MTTVATAATATAIWLRLRQFKNLTVRGTRGERGNRELDDRTKQPGGIQIHAKSLPFLIGRLSVRPLYFHHLVNLRS